jgi:WD40 repeat protein/transcriptional regulator with XRE-family HTH domain
MAEFRGLLLTYRGRSGLSQRQIAEHIGASARAVQTWESGLSYPAADRLKALIALYLARGVFVPGREAEEGKLLWDAALDEGPRFETPFDNAWFTSLLAGVPAAAGNLPASPALDSGDIPATTAFQGRTAELDILTDWVIRDMCRVVALLGLGGIGKSALAARLVRDLAPSFERIYWRSLQNALPCSEWLAGAILLISEQQIVPADDEQTRLRQLLDLLHSHRCLLVLDNFETALLPRAEGYVEGSIGYSTVLQALASDTHRGCLLVTSREDPPNFDLLRASNPSVRSLQLAGLSTVDCRAMLAGKELTGDDAGWQELVDRYRGNGLALKIVGETIREIFGGSISEFLTEGDAVFGGIRQILDAQVSRLPGLERAILFELAVAREPAGLAALATALRERATRHAVIEAVQALLRRSLLEPNDQGADFALQPVVLEYMTDRLVEQVAGEIRDRRPRILRRQALIQAQAKEYVRRSQERLIAAQVFTRLRGQDDAMLDLLASWRSQSPAEQGYGPGNIVNLLRLGRGHIRRLDLSRLVLHQVYLADVEAQDSSLAGAHLAEEVLAEAFEDVTCTALSGDGVYLAAGTINGDVRVWQVADRTLVQALSGTGDAVWSVALSADGTLLASTGADGVVRLWDAAGGRNLAALTGHTGTIWRVALSDDGKLAASGGVDATVRLWDTASGLCQAVLEGHTDAVRAVALSADGRLATSGDVSGTIRVWETASGRCLTVLEGHPAPVWSLALSADGQLAVSGGGDATVRLWDTASGRCLAVLEGHRSAVRSVAVSNDGDVAVSGGVFGTVRIWDTRAARCLAVLEAHSSTVWDVALSEDGQLAASGGGDGTVRLWQTAERTCLATLVGHTSTVWGLAVSADGSTAASGGAEGVVRLWDTAEGRLRTTLEGRRPAVWGVALSADGRVAACGGGEGTVWVWDTVSGRQLPSLVSPAVTFRAVALNHDGSLAASGGMDGRVRLWDTASGDLTATLDGHADAVRAVALSAAARIVVSGGADRTVRVWDSISGQCLSVLEGHTDAVWSVAVSADGGLAASGCVDGTVRLWDTRAGRFLAPLEGHRGAVWSVALSADGQIAASGGVDGTVRLWDTAARQCRSILEGHAATVWSVALSSNGELVASGGEDGTVRLWDTEDGRQLRVLRADRPYERMNIAGLSGVTAAQRETLLSLGAIEAIHAESMKE